jgi:hypothetical protein
MKHLQQFNKFINESALLNLPDGVSEIDNETYTALERSLERENLGKSFTEEEKTKLDGVRQLLKLQRYPKVDDYRFVMVGKWGLNGGGNPTYSAPAAWFKKMSTGTYVMTAIFNDAQRSSKYYTSESLDKLIPCVVDLIDLEIEWIKIK